MYKLSNYQFELPTDLIAQYPVYPRDASRLLVVDRYKGTFEENSFHNIGNYLGPQDLLVLNNTQVIPARLFGKRVTGGQVEVLLLERKENNTWHFFAKPGGKLKPGEIIVFDKELYVTILETLTNGVKRGTFYFTGVFEEHLARLGTLPLPPYIRGGYAEDSDKRNYQTVYASQPGAIAAPTAGLHFTKELLTNFASAEVTLHVGAGTFLPVKTEDIRDHAMHEESFYISMATAELIKKKRVVAVGTTSLRVLESFKTPGFGTTSLFIYPGYCFKNVSSLITNFHLPGSSLLMLISAFAGQELIKKAYQYAIEEKFRFFSYGDAMLIL